MKASSAIIPANHFWPWVIGALAVGIVLGRGPLSGREPHYLFVYPEKDRLSKWVECGDFGSADKARVAGLAWLGYFPEGDYKIGVGEPKRIAGAETKVFKETIR